MSKTKASKKGAPPEAKPEKPVKQKKGSAEQQQVTAAEPTADKKRKGQGAAGTQKKAKMEKKPVQGEDSRLPVTLLSGFLGAGKTTLLKHILTSKDHGLKVCVIVNDMAALNIDAVYTRNLIQREEKLVQMQNGCICCTLREDLLEEVTRLAQDHQFDYLVIESTGISEPMQVAETFAFEIPKGKEADGKEAASQVPADFPIAERPLMSVARLDTCVTMVDCASFFDNLRSIEELKDRHADEVPPEDNRNIASLLVDQIEFADVIILNKTDTVSSDQLSKIQALVTQLNPSAEVHTTTQARVPLSTVINTNKFSMDKAAKAAGWLQAINRPGVNGGTIVSESEEYGISSFVYRARRPFHPGRLFTSFIDKYFLTRVIKAQPGGEHDHDHEHEEEGESDDEGESGDDEGESGDEGEEEDEKALLEELGKARDQAMAALQADCGNLLRSKGFLWLATADEDMLSWSHAGALLTISQEGTWFACLEESEWPEDPEVRSRIKQDFDTDKPANGDRRQELVFIGQNLKEKEIRAVLDSSLATDEEIAEAAAGTLEDPLWREDDSDDEDEDSEGEEGESEEESEEDDKQVPDQAVANGKACGKAAAPKSQPKAKEQQKPPAKAAAEGKKAAGKGGKATGRK